MAVKLYNVRRILREGAASLLQDAANKENVVLLRPGSLVVKGQKVVLGVHGHAERTYGEETMGRVYKLVECTPAEIVKYQKQLNNEENQTGPAV